MNIVHYTLVNVMAYTLFHALMGIDLPNVFIHK